LGGLVGFVAQRVRGLLQTVTGAGRREPRVGESSPAAVGLVTGSTIEEVIARMTSLDEQFEEEHGARDGLLCFNRLYLAVTKAINDAVGQDGYFVDPSVVSQLDVIFAQLYFDAIDDLTNGRQPAVSAWKMLWDARDRRGVLPIQFAAAGMNAHINHDLPIALLTQWERNGRRPAGSSPTHADFTKVNAVLAIEEQRSKAGLEPGALRELDGLDDGQLGRLDDKLALWVVDDARARAWDAAEQLWDVRHVPAAQKAWLATADVVTGALGRTLLDPV
jgi:hypothetical protein